MSLTVADLKAHLNVTDTTDDAVLTNILAEATSFVEGYVGPLSSYGAEPPADLYRAIKLLAGHWFENREATTVGQAPDEVTLGFWEIINRHRLWSF